MSNYITGENKYGKYCVPLSAKHRREVITILEGKVHEQDTINYILENCNEGELIHAGTYFGDMLPAFAAAISKVWAYEPDKENYECALETLRLNKIDNVVLVNAGLGAKATKAEFLSRDRRGRSMGSAGRIVSTRSRDTESIEVVTIDQTIPLTSKISLIHLDVEYHELQALKGAIETIKRCYPVIILETKKGQEQKYQKFLDPLGYKITGRTHPTPALPEGVNTIWEKIR